MKIELTGKTALVTGSSEGIGFACAQAFAAAGAKVILNGRSQDKLDAAAERLRAAVPGAQVHGTAADLSSAEGCAALIAAEPITDILVNNAGIYVYSDFFEDNDAIWDLHWQVNVMAGVRLARHYVPAMARNGWGRVIFISSESAFNIPPTKIHYGVSKIADVAIARGLAKRMAGTGVTVNSVLPGPAASEGVAALLEEQSRKTGKPLDELVAEFFAQERPSSILRRPIAADEIANLVLYVASPLSSATTGAALRVDGGIIDTLS